MSLAKCPECGKLISLRFPIHDCKPPKKRKRTVKPKPRFCSNCNAGLTATDHEEGFCTQCKSPIKKVRRG